MLRGLPGEVVDEVPGGLLVVDGGVCWVAVRVESDGGVGEGDGISTAEVGGMTANTI